MKRPATVGGFFPVSFFVPLLYNIFKKNTISEQKKIIFVQVVQK